MRDLLMVPLAAGLAIASCNTAIAQTSDSSGLKTAEVTYAVGTQDRVGYMRASATVNYKLIVCQGEVHLAYGLASTTPTVSEDYNVGGGIGGKFVKATVPPPQLTTTTFKGGVTNGYTVLGTVADEAAGKALGYGCFTGQTKLMRLLKDLPGYRADMTPAEIAKLLDGYIIEPQALDRTLMNAQVSAPKQNTARVGMRATKSASEEAIVAREHATSPSAMPDHEDPKTDTPPTKNSVNLASLVGVQPKKYIYFFCQQDIILSGVFRVALDDTGSIAFLSGYPSANVMKEIDPSLGPYMLRKPTSYRWIAGSYDRQISDSSSYSRIAPGLTSCDSKMNSSWAEAEVNAARRRIESTGREPVLIPWRNPDGNVSISLN